jgi:spermidine synthase
LNQSESTGFIKPATISFTVAASTLLLQLVQTRIFSVVFWNHMVYFIISIALLGFGISGTWLSFGKNNRLSRILTLPNAAIGYTLSLLLSTFIIPQLGVGIRDLFGTTSDYFLLFLTYGAAILPYFFGGWILGVTFRDYAPHMHKLYFADLAGAAVGCVAFLLLMSVVGPVILSLLCCIIVLIPMMGDLVRTSTGKVLGAVCLALLGFGLIFSNQIEQGIVPERNKAYSAHIKEYERKSGSEVRFSEWNAISRIDLVSYNEDRFQRIYIDGDAWTEIPPVPDTLRPHNPEKTNLIEHLSPFLLSPKIDSALVIGPGGGIDVLHALRAGATRVDAVELNPSIAAIDSEHFTKENKNLFHRDGVKLHVEEGRSFARRTEQEYDLIMLHGIDTFAALSSGAYVLSENYLYTVEAMKDYLQRLSPDGTLCLVRWRYRGETARLFAVVLEALHELGVENPNAHIYYGTKRFAYLMARLKPFTEEELAKLKDYAEGQEAVTLFPDDIVRDNAPDGKIINEYARLRAANDHGEFLKNYRFDISPVYDDSPFFFHYEKLAFYAQIFTSQSNENLVRGNWASFTLYFLFGFSCLAVGIFILLPLLSRGRPTIPHFPSWVGYFTCLGIAFIFIEIALMQRFALLLGHPSRSLAVVLASLLLFAGIGSQLKGVIKVRLDYCLLLLVGLLLICAFAYPSIIQSLLPYSLFIRAAAAILLIAPLGILMGMPFPSGIQKVSENGSEAVPWMWGINGGITVVGSILAIIIAIWFNFTTVILIGALAYGIALIFSAGRLKIG